MPKALNDYLPLLAMIGKVGWAMLAFVFVIAVTYITNERDHDDFRRVDMDLKNDMATVRSLQASLSSDVRVITVQARRDREVAEERRQTAQRDRDEIMRRLNQLLERQRDQL